MSTSKWKYAGPLRKFEQEGSPKRSADSSGETLTSVFKGTKAELQTYYDALKSGALRVSGMTGYALVNVSLEPEAPDAATLTVVHQRPSGGTGDDSDTKEREFPTRRKLTWSFISRDIRNHPDFVGDDPSNPTVSWAYRKDIEQAIEDHQDPSWVGSEGGDSDPNVRLYHKLLRGQTAYEIAIPIITLTTYHKTEPAAGEGVNCIIKPPAAARAFGPWEWRLTADDVEDEQEVKTARTTGKDSIGVDVTKTAVVKGLFARTREYTGADKWDEWDYRRFK